VAEILAKSVFQRYQGEGNIAEMIHKTFEIGKKKFFNNRERVILTTEHFTGSRTQQLRLF
jgi:Ni,Fe-hydrogenase III large subunit